MYSETIRQGTADLSTAIGHGACKIANDIGARALVAITQSGYTAKMMARFHPSQLIIAATPSEKAYRKLALIRNVYPVITKSAGDWDQLLEDAVKAAQDVGFLSANDRIVISAGLPLNQTGNTNMIKVETVC
jgi:pyruvate kinase